MSPAAAGDGSALRISVIIPTWRDSEQLAILLPSVVQLANVAETIVVDASADRRTEEIARACGATYLRCGEPNRGGQMNLGGMQAGGDVLIFQHADTELTDEHLRALTVAMRDTAIVGGAFHRKFDDRHPRLKWIDHIARHLARNGGTLYGDQSIFARRETFRRLNGFAEIPLMEDMEFSRRLRAAGKTVVLDPPIKSSPRRHARRGSWRSSIQNGLFIVLYKLGVSPVRLHRWYYRDRGQAAQLGEDAALTS
ncbi:MAG: TIGR04283 family arsenosugar biosynthesis glycosyltransferase [Chthoniobacterales bacterium]